MKYAVWWLRLIFAAWMIPAGLNHFIPLFPQPMGNQPLSHELIVALIDSGLFNIVKAVELIAGIAVLADIYVPLALLICMPVSFSVFYWDAPLEGWGSRAALFGGTTLLTNLLLCLAYIRSYRPMFALRSQPTLAAAPKQLALAARVVFGGWLLVTGLSHFVLHLWPAPAGHEPLAIQLLAAFTDSGMLGVAMAIQLAAGALILTGIFVPVALCVVMPVSTCMLYWGLVLDRDPAIALLALAAFAVNGLLMLAYLNYYRGALQRHALSLGESPGAATFGSVFAKPGGRTSRGQFVPALLTLLAAIAFYVFVVTGRTAMWCVFVLMFSAVVLHARRLHDMGRKAWLLLVPAAMLAAAFPAWLRLPSFDAQVQTIVAAIALALSASIAVWGGLGSEVHAGR